MQLSSFREEPLEKVESRDSLHGILCLQCCFRALKGKDSEISCSSFPGYFCGERS